MFEVSAPRRLITVLCLQNGPQLQRILFQQGLWAIESSNISTAMHALQAIQSFIVCRSSHCSSTFNFQATHSHALHSMMTLLIKGRVPGDRADAFAAALLSLIVAEPVRFKEIVLLLAAQLDNSIQQVFLSSQSELFEGIDLTTSATKQNRQLFVKKFRQFFVETGPRLWIK